MQYVINTLAKVDNLSDLFNNGVIVKREVVSQTLLLLPHSIDSLARVTANIKAYIAELEAESIAKPETKIENGFIITNYSKELVWIENCSKELLKKYPEAESCHIMVDLIDKLEGVIDEGCGIDMGEISEIKALTCAILINTLLERDLDASVALKACKEILTKVEREESHPITSIVKECEMEYPAVMLAA